MFRALERGGVLLRADRGLPSVATIVAGAPIQGSWWAHVDANVIYDVCEYLDHHPDVATARLIDGKVTYVHRALWPALLAVATSREPWQSAGLSRTALGALSMVDERGGLATWDIPRISGARKHAPNEVALVIERRLLVHSEEWHTESGAHAKLLETWRRWAKRAGARRGRLTPAEGRALIEGAVAATYASEPRGRLPWQARTTASRAQQAGPPGPRHAQPRP